MNKKVASIQIPIAEFSPADVTLKNSPGYVMLGGQMTLQLAQQLNAVTTDGAGERIPVPMYHVAVARQTRCPAKRLLTVGALV